MPCSDPTSIRLSTRLVRGTAAGLVGLLVLTSCGSVDATESSTTESGVVESADAAVSFAADADGEVALFDSSIVHDIEISFDEAVYDEMIDIFTTTGEKDWIEADVVIDGTTFTDAGIRLKGNSSLFGLSSETAGNPEDLPWLIRLDKYVDGQSYQGYGDIVIRSTSTETALNEAVAQELLELSGLAAQQAIATSFTVNGGETELRLALEHPDDEWDDANFDNDNGVLYKADSEGDYSYRGDDPDAYIDVFNQKAGDDDLEPLIDFLEFINNSDDDTFSAELADRLDVDAFATYLAFQDLIGNADDINGRGNNSYLHYDYDTEQFTVVNWDLNLAFGTANVGGGGPGGVGFGDGQRPEPPAGAPADGGPGDQANVLVDRFMADDALSDLYDAKTVALTELLYESGAAADVISSWVDVVISGASDLADEATVEAEANAITDFIDSVQ